MAIPRAEHRPSSVWPLVVLIGATVLAFWPVISADFVAWDDTHNLVRNERMNPPSATGAAWYWSHPFGHLYIPATYTLWSSVAAIARTNGAGGAELNPYLFHALNLLVHLGAATVVFIILRRLTGTTWPACAGALVFALHPVQVESIAWISGLKDVLAGFLCLCAVLAYVHGATHVRRALFHLVATALFILAMLAKPSAVVLPLIVAAVDLLILRRPARASFVLLGVWLLICVPFIIIARMAQPASSLEFIPPLWSRPLVALDAIGFYVIKLIAPVHLAIDYGRSPQWLLSSGQLYFTWVIPAAIATVAIILRRRFALLAAGTAVFAIALLPVLGFVSFDFQGYSTTADHYLYLAMLGPAVVVAHGMALAMEPKRLGRSLALPIAIIILIALAIRTHVQALTWQSSEDLFAHTLTVNPDSLAANVNLGQIYANRANAAARQNQKIEAREASDRAIKLLTRALKTAPHDAAAHHNLGNALFIQGRFAEAITHYRAALERDPHNADIQNTLAAAVALQSRRSGPR